MSDLESNPRAIMSHTAESSGLEPPRVPSEADALKVEREGLPRGYRMRADAHYVDSFASASSGQPVRMLAVDDIDAPSLDEKTDLHPLVQSIRAHGVLHPLLVRPRGLSYALIAGRSRLAAARRAGLTSVPCLVHKSDDAEADLLARADNVSLRPAEAHDDGDLVAALREAVAHHLATVQAMADLVGGDAPSLQIASADVVKAHAWRAARLNDMLNLLGNAAVRPRRRRSLSSVVVQVADGFAAECRMTGVSLDCQMTEANSQVQVHDDDLFVGLSGAVCAMLPLLEKVARPALSVKLAVNQAGSVSLDVIGQGAIAPTLAARFFDARATDRPGGSCATAGALVANAVSERHGGTATFGTTPEGGCVLQLRFPRRS